MSTISPQHRANSLLDIGAYLSQRGESPGQLLREMGLPPEVLLGSHIWLDRDLVLRFSHSIEKRTGDALVGFHVGANFQLENYGAWTRRASQTINLGQVIRFTILNIHELETGTCISLHREGKMVRLRSELVGKMALDPRHQYNGQLCVLLKLLSFVAEPIAVSLNLPHRCGQLAAAEDLLGLDIVGGCEHAELVFEADALELPLAAAPTLPVRELSRDEHTCREVFRQISKEIDSERSTVAGVADALELNVRTMQRHLSSWGFSFEELIDSYRKRLAFDQLSNSGNSVTDIAHGLGYSDSAHFTRAFRRWYGIPPRAVRGNGATRTA